MRQGGKERIGSLPLASLRRLLLRSRLLRFEYDVQLGTPCSAQDSACLDWEAEESTDQRVHAVRRTNEAVSRGHGPRFNVVLVMTMVSWLLQHLHAQMCAAEK